jgi:hemolysin activation/secretion protein
METLMKHPIPLQLKKMTRTTLIMTQHNALKLTALSLALLTSFAASAQTAPNAGSVLQEQLKPQLEAPRPPPAIEIEAPKQAETLPGGVQVDLKSVRLNGNTLLDESKLLAVLGDVVGKSYDLAGLRGLSSQIGDFYRVNGYPFARAYLPPQALQDGTLVIEVIEGRYGKVTALGEPELASGGQAFLSNLKPGDVINSDQLERTSLILDDQPGIKAAPVVRPGQEIGTGDLDVLIERDGKFSGDVGIDTHGNRYTGLTRVKANLRVDSPFLFGDQIVVNSLLSDEGMWLGNLGYSLPLGTSGLRGQVGYAHTYYSLGKNFASLDASGTAIVSSLGLTYPIIRSQQLNLNVSGNFQHKELNDKQDAAAVPSSSDKSSNSVPIALSFDVRDGLAGGGITYGSLSWTSGNLKLDSGLQGFDVEAKTRGSFNKTNLDLARIQFLPAGMTGFGRVSAQSTNKNLDSSERFVLGGPSGVRAYPVGEGSGDEGWLAQAELRYAMGAFNPYAFYDAGSVKVNANPWAPGNNKRSISGGGFGVRYQASNVSMDLDLDLALAWRNYGGKPLSDTKDNSPQAWFSASYKF